MDDEPQPLTEEEFPPVYEVDFDGLQQATSEESFLQASFELLKEAAGLTTLVSGVFGSEERGYSRNDAVLVGHLVRMIKLMRSLIRITADEHGGDQQMQLIRQFLDSASTVAYLLEDPDDSSRFEAYLQYSLISEREFLANVNQQIQKRGGRKLPIEERIEKSIGQTFASAGLDPTSLPSRKNIDWPSAESRLRLLGPTAYSAYRTGSDSIHGGWHDLERNHLESVGDHFVPNFDPAPLRPQPFFAMALIAVGMGKDYLKWRFEEPVLMLDTRMDEFLARVRRADGLHEQYLTRKMGGEERSE